MSFYEGIEFNSLIPDDDVEAVLMSSKFISWYTQAIKQFKISKITFESANFFGPLAKDVYGKDIPKSNVAFIKFIADVKYGNFAVPGIVFMRGNCVAVFIVVHHKDKQYALLVSQARFPIGQGCYDEICAGMVNADGNYVSGAATEVYEETGIKLTDKDLVNKYLGSIYPSPGACDEKIELFYYDYIVQSDEDFESLQGRATGNIQENERIKCKLVPIEEVNNPKVCQDPKAIAAYAWYKSLKH